VKVFISWSGEQSKRIAEALREWLPLVVQACKNRTYMSDRDNEAGVLWGENLSSELEASNFGIICLTPSNLKAPWIHFEAGALSKTVVKARVVPLLYGLHPPDVGLPLSRFMMKQLDDNGIFDLIKSMNSALDESQRLDQMELAKLFGGMLPLLKAELAGVPAAEEPEPRSERELLEEVLELLRATSSAKFVTRGPIPAELLQRLREIAGPGSSLRFGLGQIVADATISEIASSDEDLAELWNIQQKLSELGIALVVRWAPPF
jgi:hypothetical protein